jgi:hypothetical protein
LKETKMHIDAMSGAVDNFFHEASLLQWKKNKDYHPDKVAMLEILQTAWETGITVEQDLWARIRKQMSALRRFVIEGHTESEPPRSRMIDVAVYMGMMAFWIENKVQCIKDVLDFVRESRPCETYGGLYRHTGQNMCNRIGGEESDICDTCRFQSWLASQ